MAYDIDAEKMVQVLRIGHEKRSDKRTASAKKRVDPLRSQTGLPRERIIARMIETFIALHGLQTDAATDAERALADAQARQRFGTIEWLTQVP